MKIFCQCCTKRYLMLPMSMVGPLRISSIIDTQALNQCAIRIEAYRPIVTLSAHRLSPEVLIFAMSPESVVNGYYH